MSLVVPLQEIFAETKGLLANHASWERTELGNVSSVVNGYPFKSSLFNKDKGFPVVRIRDLGSDRTETRYDGEVPKEAIIGDGDLLLGMDGIFRCCEWKFVYRTNMIERIEFATEPVRSSPEQLNEFLTLSRLAYGTADKTNRAFQVDLAIKNTSRDPILLDLNERFFSMADNNGRSAELIYFCCASKGDALPPGEVRTVQLFFRDAGWHGKGVSASAIFFRVRGFLPVVSASWKVPTLATAN